MTLVLGTRLERVQLQLPLDRLEVEGQTMGLSVLWILRLDDREPRRSAMRLEDVWVDPREAGEEVAPMTLEGVNARVTELTAIQEQDTQDIYAVIEDTQDMQTQIYQSVDALFDDSQYHYETARLLDQEALVSQEAWGCSIEAADRRSQVVTSEMLQADHRRQAEIAALPTFDPLQGQQGPSGGPAQPVALEEAGSS
ncbi:hypothetical protein Tco_0175971, partial [Tanacetum coccineum]